jgi:hypothetical protein
LNSRGGGSVASRDSDRCKLGGKPFEDSRNRDRDVAIARQSTALELDRLSAEVLAIVVEVAERSGSNGWSGSADRRPIA